MSIPHGTILGGLSTVPDMARALIAYRDVLRLELREEGALDAGLAASWGCPANAGARYAVLQPSSGAPCWFRLVEQPAHPARYSPLPPASQRHNMFGKLKDWWRIHSRYDHAPAPSGLASALPQP
jgi:hypothetical protein